MNSVTSLAYSFMWVSTGTPRSRRAVSRRRVFSMGTVVSSAVCQRKKGGAPFFTWFFHQVGVFGVTRGRGDTSAVDNAIEEVKDAMAGMLSPEIKEEVTGTAEVLQTYKISRVGTIAGCMVREGKIKRTSKVRLIRDGIVIYTGDLGSLKRFKDDVKEVASGYDCGLNINNYNDVKEGDMIEAFEEIEVSKKL